MVTEIDEIARTHEPSALGVLETHLRRQPILLFLLGLITLILYSGALSFEFVWDDWPQIVNSPILRSWSNLPRAFTSDLWYHVARHQVYYRPLFVAWSMLNYALFGLRPWGWHLSAILVYIAAVLAVFWLARKLGLEYWTAALAALIFALHPIHIEPVVWVSAASDTMVTLFVALAFGSFLNRRNPAQPRHLFWSLASLAFLMCALFTKEMAVTFPVLIGAYVLMFPVERNPSLGGRVCRGLIAAAPYAIVTLAYVLVRRHALVQSTGQFDPSHGTVDMLKTLPMVVGIYVKKLLLPMGLTGLYYTPYVTSEVVLQLVLPLCALVALAVLLWLWNRRENHSIVAFCALWFVIGLAPALYLRNFGNGDFVRDRYVCLPSVGFAILLAIGCRRLPSINRWSARAVQAAAVLLLCIFYAGASLSQQVYWDNNLLVLTRGQSLYPGNPLTLAWLASEYSQRGAHERAIELAREAAIDHPEYAYGSLALAEAYIRAGRFDEGREWLQKVNPEYVQSETGMASFAGLYGRIGDFDKAFALCDQILQKEPNLYSAVYNCGNVHFMDGQYKEAEQLLARAVKLSPEDAAPKHYLGRALLQEGRYADSQRYLQQAVALDGKVWDYHYWLGVSYEKNDNFQSARGEYQQALQLNPESQEAKLKLAAVEGK